MYAFTSAYGLKMVLPASKAVNTDEYKNILAKFPFRSYISKNELKEKSNSCRSHPYIIILPYKGLMLVELYNNN